MVYHKLSHAILLLEDEAIVHFRDKQLNYNFEQQLDFNNFW